MECKSYKFKFNEISVIPIGDVHMGDKQFTTESREKLQGYIDYIEKHENAFAFLMGDLLNCATLNSPSSPFSQNMDTKEQIEAIVKLLKPIKHKILGAIDGNHELRLARFCGYSPTISVCDRLDIPYMKSSAVILFRLGCRKTKRGKLESPRATFSGYFHHTTGGGGSLGGKINRPDKLKGIISNCDFYAGAHNHALICGHQIVYKVNETTEKIEELRQIVLTTGGYLSFQDGYAEEKMLSPLKLGSPKIDLIIKRNHEDEVKKDIHVSL
jgi:hypothetical protein